MAAADLPRWRVRSLRWPDEGEGVARREYDDDGELRTYVVWNAAPAIDTEPDPADLVWLHETDEDGSPGYLVIGR